MTPIRDFALFGLLLASPALALSQSAQYDGLTNSLSNIYRMSDARTYSISPENLTGEKSKGGMATDGTGRNAARDLEQRWKINPSINVHAGQTFTLADVDGSGQICCSRTDELVIFAPPAQRAMQQMFCK